MTRLFGEPVGQAVGTVYDDRRGLHDADVHRPLQAGISGAASEGADSIVVSGGYVDDEDYGDVIIYTGHGGNDPSTRRQVADQELTRQNLALARSCDEGHPVRVVRGSGGEWEGAPSTGFRYDGLYTIVRYWPDIGRDGFRIWRFRLEQLSDPTTAEPQADEGQAGPAPRVTTTVQRVVRTTAIAQRVKAIHDHTCQVCGTRLETPSGPYSEAAHVKPLGRPHDGPDSASNVLCLCPNDHLLFDRLAIHLSTTFDVIDTATGAVITSLARKPGHSLDEACISYHRRMCERI